MGDKVRRLLSQLLETAMHASLPALAIALLFYLVLSRVGMPSQVLPERAPAFFFGLLLLIFAVTFAVTCFYERNKLMHAFSRTDADLIGDAFGGFGAKDRLFCRAMRECAEGDPKTALEHFLTVAEDYPLNDTEKGVCAFYAGRCYQLTGAASNAAYQFRRAREHGFSEPHSLLFEARSCVKSGDFDRAYALYMMLLDMECPADFDCLYADLGFLFIRQKQPKEAAEWFRRSIDAGKCYAFALSGMSIAALLAGQYDRALEFRTRALLNHVDEPEQFKAFFDSMRAETALLHPEWNLQPAPADVPVPEEAPADTAV